MTNDDEHMRMAIAAAKKCQPEDGRIHPKVGVVLVREGRPPVVSYRGELDPGAHAEYAVLELKLGEESVAGSTVFTTLEPCVKRSKSKIPCAERLVERKVARVVIGMLDPNRDIRGRGMLRLREANIQVDFFPSNLMAEVEELNREFIRQKKLDAIPPVDETLIRRNSERSLDEWYKNLNRIYWNQNFHRDAGSIFSHLVEVVGGLSAIASNKRKDGVEPAGHIVKAIAWWAALCGKLGVRSVEQMLWEKFPGVCTYCQEMPHNPNVCTEKKRKLDGPPWDTLSKLGQGKSRPTRMREWQRLFSDIYPAQQTEEFGLSFARLSEELGELAEAVRVFRAEPGYVLSEAADVFAWLMHIQNIIDSKNETKPEKRGDAFERALCVAYPDGCKECERRVCACPPILASTIGRIAHEVPIDRTSYSSNGHFMAPDRASKFFQDGI